jgi:anti-sigma regulatory factor (Ser/Thr protein kinase)
LVTNHLKRFSLMTSPAMTSMRDGGTLVHAALLYRRPQQLRIALEEFLRDAGREAQPCLVALPGGHLEQLAEPLEAVGGDLRFEDMAEVGRNPARLIPMLLDWIDAQRRPVRVISEALWPERSYAEAAECLRHEALLNVALADRDVSVLCPYDAEHLSGEILAGAELTHPHLIDETGPRPSLTFGDPIEVARGAGWPQSEPEPPVSEMTFEGDLGGLRHALAGEPLLAALDPARRADLVFAVNEAASNSLQHGDGQATARFWRAENEVVGEVATSTAIDDPLAGRRTPDPDDTGGRGLWLINQICDLVEVRSDAEGARVRMHVALNA